MKTEQNREKVFLSDVRIVPVSDSLRYITNPGLLRAYVPAWR